ncbi:MULTISPECIES: hypothetical protein [unclassified Leclercia]|uniref:Uncharacterized protein n=1 Tax=Leclercia barmai TaxID=2785629 RepID=A0ABS7RUA6_9ENTR|nr:MULTISPECIES: hypothetical protein [unclassified Leclercia]MBZ0057458.1 hypothetical protein [Leclercia sp. EMC7]MCM5695622.1 hypothetical protein [Leclercia sp. LTM01]MCM5700030.1 hypothetical protein [Leclercia sp. LTM14]
MSRPQQELDRAQLLAEFDLYAEEHPKPDYVRPVLTSADKQAMMHRDYYENSTGNLVTPYSLPIALC